MSDTQESGGKTTAQKRADNSLTPNQLSDLVASTDTGGRNPASFPVKVLLLGVALFWSVFQLWYGSPLPFIIGPVVLNDTEARSIHLALAIFLAFTAYPALKRSPRDYVPIQDWIFALVGAFSAGYLFLAYDALAQRPGLPTTTDLVTAGVGMVLLLEATRRALGPPLMIVALVFLSYVFFGDSQYVPEVIRWQGASFQKAMSHQWLATEGVFGIALGVSTSFVFLFVLFGSLLEKAGAGNYFIKVAFALLGHLRGGPAKAAVVSSGMTGLISGSSIANVVTTGTFTIPLMKRVGFPGEKAGAVEVASSVNGQIMPPVMGAAAFLMVEYVGIPYIDVIKHAFFPALISYIALLYIVHLEALKADLQGLEKPVKKTWVQSLVTTGIVVCSLVILSGAVYYGIGWTKAFMGDASVWIISVLMFVVYAGLIWYAAQYPELELDDPEAPVYHLPEVGPTVKSGLHYLLPVVLLIWLLMVERKSPGLSAFWACAAMIFILITQRPLFALFRRIGNYGFEAKKGGLELIDGLISGARNMIGIGVATAAAGIIVGTVTLTGIGQVMAEFVEFLSQGSIILMLIFTAVISLILGMGLPTTANYIVVSSLMAPVVVSLGAEAGLVVPLIAVHLFVFYFGIMADVTPPVGLASFAASAVSGADPIKTGFTAFFYSLRTVALPFIFIFNTELLMIGIDGPFDLILTVVSATIAMLVFAAATQGYFFARSRIWESVLLLAIAFTLFRPGFWLDQIQSPFEEVPPGQIAEQAGEMPAGAELRMTFSGPDFDNPDEIITKTLMVPLGEQDAGEARLEEAGVVFSVEDGQAVVEEPFPGTYTFERLQTFDFYGDPPVTIARAVVPAERMPKELFFIPALVLLGGLIFLQTARNRREGKDKPASGASGQPASAE